MTREDAVAIARKHAAQNAKDGFFLSAGGLIHALEELGVLKFEQPKTATDRALAALNRQNVAGGGGVLSSKTLCEIMDSADCRIVDKS